MYGDLEGKRVVMRGGGRGIGEGMGGGFGEEKGNVVMKYL